MKKEKNTGTGKHWQIRAASMEVIETTEDVDTGNTGIINNALAAASINRKEKKMDFEEHLIFWIPIIVLILYLFL